VATEAKILLKSWKQLVSSSPRAAAQPKQADTTSTAPEVKAPETKSSEGAVVIPPLEPGADALRSKVRQKLGDVIKNAAVGAHVEAEMLRLFPFEDDIVLRTDGPLGKGLAKASNSGYKKDYQNKFRQLFTNLKRNAILSADVASGAVPPSLLVTFDNTQLATKEKAAAHAKMSQDNKEAVESDWAIKHEEKINKELGIVDTGGVEPCEECESMNTVIIGQQQTRGCDEPMTVFFRCKDCNAQWNNDGSS
jgi:DNA-directed RNA polymerase subunit M/transcription elongation factor TFIIS